MRKMHIALAGVVLGLAFNSNAQTAAVGSFNGIAQPIQAIGELPAQPDSIVSVAAESQGLSPIAPEDLPSGGTYWWVEPNGQAIPTPFPPPNLNQPIYQITDSQFLVDQTGGQVLLKRSQLGSQMATDSLASAATAQANAVVNLINQVQDAQFHQEFRMAMGFDLDSPEDSGSSLTPEGLTSSVPDYGTNLWIIQMGITNGYLTSIGTNTEADVQYEIQSCTNLSQPNWQSEGFILGSELANWTPLSVPQLGRTNLFIRLKSWIDSDNVGIPDWWQLLYFGYVGINPYALSPAGDGYTIWQKYQNGLNPNVFETPPAPNNFVAVLSTNGTNVLLSWDSAQGSVTSYTIVKAVYDYSIDDFDYSTIATVSSGTNSYLNIGAFQNSDPYSYYELTANYPGGNLSDTAYSDIYDTAPAPSTSSAPTYNIYVSATLIRNGTGRWQLMFSGLSANAPTVNLIWTDGNGNSTTQGISAGILTNGVYQIPDANVVNYLGDSLSVQGVGVNGEPGQVAQAGVLPNDAPYFVDGRQHMKQNLTFMIRGASQTTPFFAEITEFREFVFGGFGIFYDPLVGEMNQSSTNFEEFSFLHHGSWNGGAYEDLSNYQLDNLWPFTVNYDLANYFVNTTRTNYLIFGSTNFTYSLNFTTNIPAPPMLTHADPYWILQPSFIPNYTYFSLAIPTPTNWAVTVTSTQTVATLASGSQSLFDLPYQTGCVVDMDENHYGLDAYSLYQSLAPGSSVTANSGYVIGGYANWCPAPTLQLVNYYSVPLANPSLNPMGLPGAYDNYYNSNRGIQPLTPLEDDFNVTNQTPPVIIGAVGQPMILASWAKFSVLNGSIASGKYAYLGQYFTTNTWLLDDSGNPTTNSAGILSPYGEFFPTQAGKAQLITMPDIDTGQQGTNIVQIISLNVDANHDGTMDLSYFGQDQTSPSQPYIFWCNNNFDRTHYVDGTDVEQDDVPQWDNDQFNLDPGDADCNYNVNGSRVIPCRRDLEDFSRLWINGVTSNLLSTLPAGSSITLNWGDVGSPNSGNPTIDLFTAADVDGGIGYLTNSTTAGLQINQSLYPYVGRLAPGGSIQLNLPYVPSIWAGNHFIWCGVTNGSGKLNLTFQDAKGNILGQASVYIQIQDIKQMYERWTVGDNTAQPPATTASPAGDLPSDMTQAFSYATLATTNTPYILFVHGWNMNTWEKDRYAETELKRLWWQGYQGRFGSFRWPTYFNFPFEAFQWQAIDINNFDNSELNAWKSGAGLLNLLTSLNTQYPGQVYLTAHSMGNVVAGEALRLASSRVVNTYVAMQGAVSAHAYDSSTVNRMTSSLPDDYGHYWTNGAPSYFNSSAGAGTYVNFFNTNDFALNAAHWGLDQDVKPHLGYGYQPLGNFWYYGVTGLSYTTEDRYTIFADCDPSWSYALGAQADVGGVFGGNQIDLSTVWPFDAGSYSAHRWHSAEFRSDNTQRWLFWDEVLFQMGLKKNL